MGFLDDVKKGANNLGNSINTTVSRPAERSSGSATCSTTSAR